MVGLGGGGSTVVILQLFLKRWQACTTITPNLDHSGAARRESDMLDVMELYIYENHRLKSAKDVETNVMLLLPLWILLSWL